jgi:hypothetical protein
MRRVLIEDSKGGDMEEHDPGQQEGWVGKGPCKGHVQFSSQVGNGMVRKNNPSQGKRKSGIMF